jgi:ribose transport system ATP-binding protein
MRATAEMNIGEKGEGLLILDEPTPFLPREDVHPLFKVMRSVAAKGASVVFVFHDIDEVLEITDRATILHDGRVAARLITRETSKQAFIEAIVGSRWAPVSMSSTGERSGPAQLTISGLKGGANQGLRS